MNIFLQGMRRSGTTVVFDLLWATGEYDCYYEPCGLMGLHERASLPPDCSPQGPHQ